MDEYDTKGQVVGLVLTIFLIPAIAWLVGTNLAMGDEGTLVQELSFVAIGCGLAQLLLILIAPLIAGTNRNRMALMFGPMVRLVMVLLAVSVVVQGGLFIYSLFTFEATLLNRVHFGILLAVGFGAVVACLVLLGAAISMLKTEHSNVRGKLLNRESAPALFDRVGALAERIGANRPDNIILGLEPNFYVTAAPIRLIGENQQLHGTSLFASLSLMRIFSQAEFDAVIGHELGHFRGEDVTYSIKFAPTYARLSRTLTTLGQSTEGAADFAKLPATFALALCLSRFASAERTVGRQRELVADQAGAAVASPRALATALLKVILFSFNWHELERANVEALQQGHMFVELSRQFHAMSELDPNADWEQVLGSLTWTVQAHPTDTHPPFSERLDNLGISIDTLRPEDCAACERPAAELVPGADEIDRELSSLEAQWLVAIGATAQ